MPNHVLHTHTSKPYVEELHPITLDAIDKSDKTAIVLNIPSVGKQLYDAFRSLLGALQWLLMTRGDICCHVGYMQRNANKPLVEHLCLANSVLRHCKRVKTGLFYQQLKTPLNLVLIADSAYKCDDDDDECLALQGYIVALVGHDEKTYPGGTMNVLEFLMRKHKHITRSTYAAELRNAVEAASDTIEISMFLQELSHGPMPARKLVEIKENGNLQFPIHLCVDNRSVFDSISGSDVTCTDKSMILHARAFREMCDMGIVSALLWIDTRDMLADVLTKGSVDKQAILKAFNTGIWQLAQLAAVKKWSSNKLALQAANARPPTATVAAPSHAMFSSSPLSRYQ